VFIIINYNGRLYTKKSRKKSRVRLFQTSWLDDNIFKGWLARHPTEDNALCLACNKTITCFKANLVRHSQSVQHLEQLNKNKENLNVNVSDSNNNRVTLSHIEKVKRVEIKLAAYFAEHNISFYSADHLIPLLKDICAEPKVVLDLLLARDKCTNIVTKIIAKREVQKLTEYIQNCKFLILIVLTFPILKLCVFLYNMCQNF